MVYYILVAASVPPPLPSIDDILPQFKIGDRVCTIPDSLPGVDRRQAEAFYGSVSEVKFDCTWYYNIKSMHFSRNTLWVPEARVLPMPTSISDGSLMATRNFPVQQRLADVKSINVRLKEKYSDMKALNPVLGGEISRLKVSARKLHAEVTKLRADNNMLATDLRETRYAAIFSRATPEGNQAVRIRSRIECIELERDTALEKAEDGTIKMVLNGLSIRQGASLTDQSRSTMDRWQQRVGWAQEVINGVFFADCGFIRELGCDGGSISKLVIRPLESTRILFFAQ